VSIIQFWVSSYFRADWSMQSTFFENRTRFMLRAVKAVMVHVVWGEKPLFVRLMISASDSSWAEGPKRDSCRKWLPWSIEQTILLTGDLRKLDVDLIDVSSGGNWPAQNIPVCLSGVPGTQFYLLSLRRKRDDMDTDHLRFRSIFIGFVLQRRSRRHIRTFS
jgi:2,4-dienoyl-CoA reductase-like NADH-dependent reductase (Old Yellow Enzyme family)